LTNTTRFS